MCVVPAVSTRIDHAVNLCARPASNSKTIRDRHSSESVILLRQTSSFKVNSDYGNSLLVIIYTWASCTDVGRIMLFWLQLDFVVHVVIVRIQIVTFMFVVL